MPCPLKVLICLGSVRDGRMCERVGKYLSKTLTAANFQCETLDPLELDLPLLKQPLQFYPDPTKAPRLVQELNEKIKQADAYMIVTAEYNRQMPPALTNMLDHFPPKSYAFKASAIASYSLGAGGQSAVAQARTLMVEFGAPPVPYTFHLGEVQKKLDENGQPLDKYLEEQSRKLITQLTFFATAMKNHRKLVGEPQWPTAANFWENGLWPGPPHKANNKQCSPQIFSFHYENNQDASISRGLIFCRLCDEICLDAVGLYQHQTSLKHSQSLEKLKLTATHPILRLCTLCNELVAGGQKFFAHARWHDDTIAKARETIADQSKTRKSETPPPRIQTPPPKIEAPPQIFEAPPPREDDEAEILPLLNLILEKNLQENLENKEVDLILEILARKTGNLKTQNLIKHLLQSRMERRAREEQIQNLLKTAANRKPVVEENPIFLKQQVDNQAVIQNLMQILAGNAAQSHMTYAPPPLAPPPPMLNPSVLAPPLPAQLSFPAAAAAVGYISRAESSAALAQPPPPQLPTRFASVCPVSREEMEYQLRKLLAPPSCDYVFDGRSLVAGERSIVDDRRSVVDDRRSMLDDRRSMFDDRRSMFDDRRSVASDRRSVFDDRRSVLDDGRSVVVGDDVRSMHSNNDDESDLPFYMTSRAKRMAPKPKTTTTLRRPERQHWKLDKVEKAPKMPVHRPTVRSQNWSLESEKRRSRRSRLRTSSPPHAPASPLRQPDLVSDISDHEENTDKQEINLEYNSNSDLFQNRSDYSNQHNDDVITLSGLEAISDDEDQKRKSPKNRDDRKNRSRDEKNRSDRKNSCHSENRRRRRSRSRSPRHRRRE